MASNEKQLKIKVTADTKSAESSFDKFKNKIKEATKGFTDLKSAFDAGVGIANKVLDIAKAAAELGKKADEFSKMKTGFVSLSKAAGETADVFLGKLRRATDGTVADFGLVQKATQAMLAGLNPKDIETIFSAADAAADRTGGSFEEMADKIIMGVRKGRVEMLASAGIIVDQNKAFQTYADKLGIAASALDENAQKQAVLEEAMRKAKELTEKLGESNTVAGVKIKRFSDMVDSSTASWENLKITIGSRIATTFVMLDAVMQKLGIGMDKVKTIGAVMFAPLLFVLKPVIDLLKGLERLSDPSVQGDIAGGIFAVINLFKTLPDAVGDIGIAIGKRIDGIGMGIKAGFAAIGEGKNPLTAFLQTYNAQAGPDAEAVGNAIFNKFKAGWNKGLQEGKDIGNFIKAQQAGETGGDASGQTRDPGGAKAVEAKQNEYLQILQLDAAYYAQKSAYDEAYRQGRVSADSDLMEALVGKEKAMAMQEALIRANSITDEKQKAAVIAKVHQDLNKAKLQYASQAASGMATIFGNLAQIEEMEGRKGKAKHKNLMRAQIIFATAAGAMNSYNSLSAIPFVGPVLGAAAAASAVMLGAAQLRALEAGDAGTDLVGNAITAVQGQIMSNAQNQVTGAVTNAVQGGGQQPPAAADGAYLIGSQNGTLVRAAENSRSEMILPIDNPEAVAKLRNALGVGAGGGVTINFNGPVMGDAQQAREFARMIDRELYEMKTHGTSAAFS